MRRVWLGLICGALIAASPCASAQDLNAAILQYNCGAPAAPPPVPNGRRASAQDFQDFVTHANAWQSQQQQIMQCVFAASAAMDTQIDARVQSYNQHISQGQQAAAAWQATASGQH